MGTDDNGYELAVGHQLGKAAKLRTGTRFNRFIHRFIPSFGIVETVLSDGQRATALASVNLGNADRAPEGEFTRAPAAISAGRALLEGLITYRRSMSTAARQMSISGIMAGERE
jgi:hypothetical protein